MITIKLMNDLGSLFKTYLTMLSQKARNDNKLPNLQLLLSNPKDKKRHIKQIINSTLLSHILLGLVVVLQVVDLAYAHKVVEVYIDKMSHVKEIVV